MLLLLLLAPNGSSGRKKLGQRGLERERESYFALSNQSSLEREEIYQQLLDGQAGQFPLAYLISL